MKDNNIVSKLVIVLVIVVLCIPIVMDIVANSTLRTIKYKDYEDALASTGEYGFNLMYVDDSSKDGVKETKDNVKELVEKYTENNSNIAVSASFMNTKKMSDEEIKNVLGENKTSGYVFMVNREVLRIEDARIEDARLEALVSEYSQNGISKDETYYKVAENAKAYQKLVKDKKKVTMAVFGRDNCFFCNQFKSVYNTVAEMEGIDIYYFDSTSYDAKEYSKIMDLGLKIPASCREDGKEALLKDGFNTPLTLFTKNGKVIDCIGGYVNKATLMTKLKTVGILEDK